MEKGIGRAAVQPAHELTVGGLDEDRVVLQVVRALTRSRSVWRGAIITQVDGRSTVGEDQIADDRVVDGRGIPGRSRRRLPRQVIGDQVARAGGGSTDRGPGSIVNAHAGASNCRVRECR